MAENSKFNFFLLFILTLFLKIDSINAGWGTAEIIDAATGFNADSAQIAYNDSGKAIAVFRQLNTGQYRIYAKKYDGTNWAGGTDLIDPGGPASFIFSDPQIAINDSGKALAVYRKSNGTNDTIFANKYNGTTWGVAKVVDLGGGSKRYYDPQVAFNDSGKGIVVFRQFTGTRDRIFANKYNGTAWGTADTIDAGGASMDFYDAQVAFDDSGRGIAVFRRFDGTKHRIYANKYATGAWGTAQLIDAGQDSYDPQIVINKNGKGMAVFRKTFAGTDSIFANNYNGSSWGTAQAIDSGGTGNNYFNPQIAYNDIGNAIAVFERKASADSSVYANSYNGATWSTAERIDAGGAGVDYFNPQIALSNDGSAMAVFRRYNGTIFRIYANGYDGTTWGTPDSIDAGADSAGLVQVAFDNNGNGMAVFRQKDATYTRIYANKFLPDIADIKVRIVSSVYAGANPIPGDTIQYTLYYDNDGSAATVDTGFLIGYIPDGAVFIDTLPSGAHTSGGIVTTYRYNNTSWIDHIPSGSGNAYRDSLLRINAVRFAVSPNIAAHDTIGDGPDGGDSTMSVGISDGDTIDVDAGMVRFTVRVR